ncbi:MAG: hypothetical protein HC867_00875 [Bacteroidia bacterium]|nr:hypothetical protein [Bacteroidia bacterium]
MLLWLAMLVFPWSVFDSKGNRLSSEDQQALEDIRGIWYNGMAKAIQVNCFADHGWVEYILDKNGNPEDIKYLLEDMAQPDDQSAGAYDPDNNRVIFLDEMGYVAVYAFPTGEHVKEFPLHLRKTSGKENADDNEKVIDDYNSTNIIFTGIKKAELGVLNTKERKVELYDISTGYLTRILKLPADALVATRLNFSYTNGMVFLFDQTSRVWIGYK